VPDRAVRQQCARLRVELILGIEHAEPPRRRAGAETQRVGEQLERSTGHLDVARRARRREGLLANGIGRGSALLRPGSRRPGPREAGLRQAQAPIAALVVDGFVDGEEDVALPEAAQQWLGHGVEGYGRAFVPRVEANRGRALLGWPAVVRGALGPERARALGLVLGASAQIERGGPDDAHGRRTGLRRLRGAWLRLRGVRAASLNPVGRQPQAKQSIVETRGSLPGALHLEIERVRL